jgi:hypothetical protein
MTVTSFHSAALAAVNAVSAPFQAKTAVSEALFGMLVVESLVMYRHVYIPVEVGIASANKERCAIHLVLDRLHILENKMMFHVSACATTIKCSWET